MLMYFDICVCNCLSCMVHRESLTRLAAFIAGVTLFVPGEQNSGSSSTSTSSSRKGSGHSVAAHRRSTDNTAASSHSPKRRDHSADVHGNSSSSSSATEASGQLHTALKEAVLAAGLRGK